MERFPITSVCKEDILSEFEDEDNYEEIKDRVERMTDEEMKTLADKMRDDYCEQLFWSSLRGIFKASFMRC